MTHRTRTSALRTTDPGATRDDRELGDTPR